MNYVRRQGFTLVEALLSCMILAIGALVIGGLSQRCIENNVHGWEYEQGWRLLDECLDRVISDKQNHLLKQASVEGDFGERYPDYRYVLKIEATNESNLYKVQAMVLWDSSGQEYQVETTSLMYDLSS